MTGWELFLILRTSDTTNIFFFGAGTLQSEIYTLPSDADNHFRCSHFAHVCSWAARDVVTYSDVFVVVVDGGDS